MDIFYASEPQIEQDRDQQRPALAPVLPRTGPVPPYMDEILAELAYRAATGDISCRNTLYAAYAPRLDHSIRRFQRAFLEHRIDPAIESADIRQEAFVVFSDLVAAWSGTGSLSAYVIAFFPWRLSNALRRMSDSRLRRSLDTQPSLVLVDGSYAADQALLLLEVFAADLPERQRQVILLRIRDGRNWYEIADELGVNRRTALRDWKLILERLRRAYFSPAV